MIEHEIHIHADPPLTARFQQGFTVLHCSERRIDRVIVIHIILVIGRRRMHGSQPDRVKSQIFNIIQFGPDAVQVPDPVSVRVAERINKDLIGRTIIVICLRPHKVFVIVQHLDMRSSGLTAARCITPVRRDSRPVLARCLLFLLTLAASCDTQHRAQDHAYDFLYSSHPDISPICAE